VAKCRGNVAEFRILWQCRDSATERWRLCDHSGGTVAECRGSVIECRRQWLNVGDNVAEFRREWPNAGAVWLNAWGTCLNAGDDVSESRRYCDQMQKALWLDPGGTMIPRALWLSRCLPTHSPDDRNRSTSSKIVFFYNIRQWVKLVMDKLGNLE
jgi:hypothetical protein